MQKMINIEYKKTGYQRFYQHIKGKMISVVSDINTKPFISIFKKELENVCKSIIYINFDEKELIPDEHCYERVIKESEKVDYILCFGSGSLNDVCKYASTQIGIPCGVVPTAASMDGYLSKGSALIEKGVKVTESVHTPSDVLIDIDIIATAPREMTGAGFGDILGKYTCLMDWQLAHYYKGEEINEEAFNLMQETRDQCVNSYEQLKKYDKDAIEKLISALVYAGEAMAICGNSRPASGSEHHASHYLEMEFIKKHEPIPPHGIKVALGTMLVLDIYKYLLDNNIQFKGSDDVYSLARKLPSSERIKEMLIGMGCPIRYRDINVDKDMLEGMLFNAHTVRDRFTVLSLVNELNLMKDLKDMLIERYY